MGILHSDKLIVGYDLGNRFSQISFALSETGDVETLSMVAGSQNYNIPTVLCKRYGANQWFFGREALRYAEEEQGVLVENLLELALDGEPVIIEGETFNPVALLALFFKRSLGLLSSVGSPDKVTAIMITCPTMDRRMMDVLGEVVDGLNLKSDRVFYQSHTESFYDYMIHQPKELWTQRVLLFHYREKDVKTYCMECNRRTTPVVTFVEEQEFLFTEYPGLENQDDEVFGEIARKACGEELVSCAFLIGDGFAGEWLKESLRFLCQGRRVFQGNNLFSKGACHGMQERLQETEEGKSHVFLGKDKLKANIGMKILRNGQDSYYALLDAGGNWYEAETEMEFYLQDGNSFEVMITPLIGKNAKTAVITLEDLPGNIARLYMKVYMESESKMTLEITDLGFGEFRLPSEKSWTESVDIYEKE